MAFVGLLLHGVPQNILQDVINYLFLIHTCICHSESESRGLQSREMWLAAFQHYNGD